MGVYGDGPISNPKDLGPGHQTRHRRRQARRAGAGGRAHSTAMISFSSFRRIVVWWFRVFVVSCAGCRGLGHVNRSAADASATLRTASDCSPRHYCYSCHGTGRSGRRGAADSRSRQRRSADSLRPQTDRRQACRRTRAKVIADQDLVDINAYLRSIPASPSAKSIALLQQ